MNLVNFSVNHTLDVIAVSACQPQLLQSCFFVRKLVLRKFRRCVVVGVKQSVIPAKTRTTQPVRQLHCGYVADFAGCNRQQRRLTLKRSV